MRRAAVDAVNVAVDSRRVGQTVFRARIHGIVSGSVEQAAGRVSGRRRSHRNPVHLPLEPIFTTLGHGRVDAFLRKRKKKRTQEINGNFPKSINNETSDEL